MNEVTVQINILAFVIELLITIKSIHIMQLNSYNVDQQILWYKKNVKEYLSNIILLFLIICNKFFLRNTNYSLNFKSGPNPTDLMIISNVSFLLLSLMVIPICVLVILIENLPRKAKKKLVWTSRAKRLLIFNIIIFLGLTIFFEINKNTTYSYLLLSITHLVNFIVFMIMSPIETAIRNNFKNKAKIELEKHTSLHKVAITGSYGKTSVKHFLREILSENYNVCMTPGSFNTPMGITLTINNDLKNTDDIFIAEFGARRVGDIKELAEFFNPTSCIISEVGNQHLDTFKTVENVLNTKFEVVDYILNKPNQDKSYILVNGDNELIRKKIFGYKENNKLNNHRIYTFGLNDDNDFYAYDIKVENINNNVNTIFKVCKKTGINYKGSIEKEVYDFSTGLIGKHNIINILVSISYAMLYDVDYKNILYKVKNLNQVEHRLEVKKISNDIVLIDDAYNSNPIGAKNAVNILSDFKDYKKVIITPGMVELGDRQYEENKKFGEEIAKNVDIAIIVNKVNKSAIFDGIENVTEKSIISEKKYFDKFIDAYNYAMKNISGKKVILLENDLTDNY